MSGDGLPDESVSSKLPSIPLYSEPAPQVRISVWAMAFAVSYKDEGNTDSERDAVTESDVKRLKLA